MLASDTDIDDAGVDELIRSEEQALAAGQPAPPQPLYVSHGRGSRIWDIDRNEFVDCHNGDAVMNVGHAHPKIVEAVKRRVELGPHSAPPTADALAVAEKLAERTGRPSWRCANSGTRPTLDASPLRRAATGPDLLLPRW